MRKIAVGDLGEFWYGDYKEPFVQLEGAVEGHPQGVVLKDDAGRVMCAYCGKTFDNLPRHVKAHGMTVREYKDETGLLQKSSLVSEKVRLRRIELGLRHAARMRDMAGDASAASAKATTGRPARASLRTPEHLNKTGRCFAQLLEVGRSIRREHGRVSIPLMKKRGIPVYTVLSAFGTWERFQELVGSPKAKNKPLSDRELVTALSSLAAKVGRTPSRSDLRRYGAPDIGTYARHFGSYAKACEEAGLPPNLPKVLGDTEAQHILSAYAAGTTMTNIATAMRVPPYRVREVLGAFGIEMVKGFGPRVEEQRTRAARVAADMVGE